MVSAVLLVVTVAWLAVAVAVATDWRGIRSRRPTAYPLLAVGGLLYVAREWVAALWGPAPSVETALAAGSNLAFLAALVLIVRRWVRFRRESG